MNLRNACIAAIVTLLPAALNAAAIEGADHGYATLLLSTNGADVRAAAQALSRGGTKNLDVFDVAAELLWRACTASGKLDADSQAWLAIALGASGSARYRAILSGCAEKAQDGKVADHAREALGHLPPGDGVTLAGGSLEIEQVAAQLAASSHRDASARSAAKFATVAFGQSIDDVYKTLGLPDALQSTQIRSGAVRWGPVNKVLTSTQVMATYAGLGSVTFTTGGDRWTVASFAQASRGGNENPRAAQARQMLSTSDPNLLRGIAQDLLARGEKDPAVLDEVAERINFSSQTHDKQMADALAYLCELLGKSGNGRYKAFLSEVGNTGYAHALRRHASNAAADLPESKEAPFQPSAAAAPSASTPPSP